MRPHHAPALALLLYGLIVAIPTAQAYPVGPSLPLDKLYEEADLVCKVTAVSSKEVEDAWFEAATGFRPHETRLAIIAVYRGEEERKEIVLRHYARSEKDSAHFYQPQHYEFEAGRTYILFAKKGKEAGEYRQLWKNHRAQEDQGLLLAADNVPHTGLPIAEIFWLELTGLLQSKELPDVKYALSHLDMLSGGDYREVQDLDRSRVLGAIAPLLKSEHAEIVQAAIAALSGHNPYMAQDYNPGWLATVGKGHIPGYGTWDVSKESLGGKLYWKELAAVAESDTAADTRSLAIRALGRGGAAEVLTLAEKWLRDPEPKIRRAAAVLLADYPDRANTQLLKQLTKDSEPIARQGAAQAIGYGQFEHLIPELGTLVDDRDPEVAQSAALSLLSFSLEHSHDTLKAHLNHPEYHPLFLNALAQEDAAPYLEQLCEAIRKNKVPEDWWGGFVPWGDSWKVLYKYAQAQPAAKLSTPRLAAVLDALEYPTSGDPQGPTFYSSSEPRDLYALYLQRSLTDRAKKFRATCKQAVSYDIDYYFNMVDADPGQYGGR